MGNSVNTQMISRRSKRSFPSRKTNSQVGVEKSDLKADESDPQTQTENKDGLVEQNEIPPMIDLELHSQRKLRHAVSALPPKIGSAASRTKSHSMMSNSAVKKWKLEDQIIKEDLEVSLEDLEIQEQICLSKFGAIHHGKLMGIEVQVNFLDKDKLTPHLIDYIKRTLFLVKEIRHPNVLSLLGSHLEDHPNFIVTERCEYGNLASVLFTSENLLNCMRSISICWEIARGVAYLNQECSISIHNLNSRNIYISSDFHAKIGNFSRFIVYNQMVPFPTNTTSSYFDDLFPNIFPPEEHDSVISREDQHSFHIRPLQQARDVYYFGVIMFECFTRRKFSQSEKIDSSISWLPRSLRNILISCLQPNVSLRPSFSKLISVLGELLICSEVELFQNYDLPRILNYLKSDSTHLQLLAAKEIFTLGGEHGRCYRCGHMSNAQFFGQRLCDAGALQTLSDLLFASTTNVSKACVIAISSLLSIESISRGRLRMKYLGQISSSNSIKTLLNLVSSIDRDVSRSARNVLVIISQNTELSSEMVFSLNQKMANRFLQELHGDITSVKQQIEAFQKELKLKEERLERYEQSLADTTQFKLRDKYDISVEIGSGAFSSVFYCKNKISGKRCAVKSIDLDKISQFSSFNYGKLEEEFNIMSALIHPNIITMEEFFLENRTLHLIMELAEFGDLFDYLVDKKRLRESDARRISKDILNAIAYLHSMGILHRDLKPANILLTGDEHKPIIKLADFGFAKFQKNDAEDSVFSLKHLKRAHSELGTIGYAAPEIFDGGVYDERVDIWSFGIILHIMLCGYPPYCDIRRHEETGKLLVDNTPFWTHFQRMKLPVLSNEVLSDNDPLTFESEYWKEISSEAKDLVTQCLQINQRKRPVASQCLEHPWFSLDMGYPKLPPEKMKELESKLKFKTLDDIIKDRSFF